MNAHGAKELKGTKFERSGGTTKDYSQKKKKKKKEKKRNHETARQDGELTIFRFRHLRQAFPRGSDVCPEADGGPVRWSTEADLDPEPEPESEGVAT